MIPPRIKEVEALDNFLLKITYITEESKIYDMKKILQYKCYEKLNNLIYFKMVKCAETTVQWPEGEDIDPNELYENSILLEK